MLCNRFARRGAKAQGARDGITVNMMVRVLRDAVIRSSSNASKTLRILVSKHLHGMLVQLVAIWVIWIDFKISWFGIQFEPSSDFLEPLRHQHSSHNSVYHDAVSALQSSQFPVTQVSAIYPLRQPIELFLPVQLIANSLLTSVRTPSECFWAIPPRYNCTIITECANRLDDVTESVRTDVLYTQHIRDIDSNPQTKWQRPPPIGFF